MATKWAVVGGGMLGGVCALRLAEAGHQVTLFESQATLGGLTSQVLYEGMTWDRFYHVIEDSDLALLGLLSELELSKELIWDTTNTNFYDGEKIYPLNNALDYLKLPVLSTIDKLRIGLTILYGSSIKNGASLDNIPLSDWLIKWSGSGGFHNLWLPLLRGKLGDNYKIASAAFIWSVIQRFYGARSGVKKTETFGYVRGGYAAVLDRLNTKLKTSGVTVRTAQQVTSIAAQTGKFEVKSANNLSKFERVLATVPSPVIPSMCSQLSATEKNRHENLIYQGVVCVSLLIRKPLGGAYLTYITDQALPFTTIIEMTNLVDTANYAGNHLIYLPKYVPANHSLFDEDDDGITRSFISGLKRMFPYIQSSDIVTSVVSRARNVTTVPTLNYAANKPDVSTSIAGLYICNSAQISNAALSVNESVKLADHTVSKLLEDA